MHSRSKDIDVAHNLKVIEWLKAELVDSVGELFRSLLKTGSDATSDALATIIITVYLLGRRVGISFQNVDRKIRDKLDISIKEAQDVEEWYGDLDELFEYLEGKKR